MQTINKLAPLIIIIAVIVVGFFVYDYFFGGPDEPTETVLSPESAGEGIESNVRVSQEVGADLVRLRARLNRISINADVVEDERFRRLNDITTSVPSVDFGRENPFLPTRF